MPATAQPVSIPAPWAGMNTRDGVASLQPTEARFLENWDCEGNNLVPRKGFVTDSTGGEDSFCVKTLAPWSGATGSQRIGINGGKIWDFSSSVAVLLYDGAYADDRFQTENYNGYLFGVNGTDTPWRYDGSSVLATGFSGVGLTLTNLINVRKARNRLWFCEKDSADVWYGSLGGVTGTLTKFQLSQIASGGKCMAIGAHSQDAGAGPDDYTAFVMSTGEVILYTGDPSTTFTKVGNYFMQPPVGRQCLVNIGGPLAVITTIGLVPLQAAVTGVAGDVFSIGNYGKIGPSVVADVKTYGTIEGWHAVYHEGKVILNVPTPDDTAKQWVYNSLTGAWTSWMNIDTCAFCVSGSDLYFGSTMTGTVFKRSGYLDDGEVITLTSRGAFITNPNGRRVVATAIKFDMLIDGAVSGKYGLDANYLESDISANPTVDIASSTASTPWGSDWGSDWSDQSQFEASWLSAEGEGQSLAIALEVTVNVSSLQWPSGHLLIRQAGIR